MHHKYFSTACWHDLHIQCRLQCKFCDVHCNCPCHDDIVAKAPDGQVRMESDDR